ncbi:2770_t:CDS:1, partial [Acaulospora morrowiae]
MLDITGMFAESLEALTSTTGHTFTNDYDSSSSNYEHSSTPIYD